MARDFLGWGRWLAVRGVAALGFGLATLVWPHVTLWALVVLWGAYALVDGAATLAAVVTGAVGAHRGWWAVSGLAGIAAGVVSFAWPSITALALLFVIAAWALVSGGTAIGLALRLRRVIEHEWRLGVSGLLSVVLGVLLVAAPGEGALAITWAIGWFATLSGIMLVTAAARVRRVARAADRALSDATASRPARPAAA
jgi:uncharacterized membrane protein HdeD (DUF308 family)